jgi:hypothetical protein
MSVGPDEDLRFAEDHIANLEAALDAFINIEDGGDLNYIIRDHRHLLEGGYCRLSCHHAKYDTDTDDCGCPCHEEE